MMRSKMYVLCLLLGSSALPGKAQMKLSGPFRVTVNMSSLKQKPQKLVLHYHATKGREDIRVSDTTTVEGNRASFSGTTEVPYKDASLEAIPMTSIGMPVFHLQPGDNQLTTGEYLSQIESYGMYTKDFKALAAANEAYIPADTLTAEEAGMSAENEQAYMLKMAKQEQLTNRQLEAVNQPFVIRYATTSPVAVYALNQYAGDPLLLIRSESLATTDSLFHLLSPALQKIPAAIDLKQRIDAAKRVAIGKKAPAFTQPDTTGKKVTLASFRGKYVLVDFWASWCHWCRAESPNVIKAFHQYQSKKFTVLGVSLDNKSYEKAWKNAIHKDGTGIWAQVCELSDKKNIAALYGVKAIPQNFLINPEGVIIGVNLHGEGLNKKLSELFD